MSCRIGGARPAIEVAWQITDTEVSRRVERACWLRDPWQILAFRSDFSRRRLPCDFSRRLVRGYQ